MNLIFFISCFLLLQTATALTKNIVCYYDASSYVRSGAAKLLPSDLELSLQFCTHLVYGYAGIHHSTLEVISLNVDLDMFYYSQITALKQKYPHLQVFLSVGGDKDVDQVHPLKYLGLLESNRSTQQTFIDSAISLLKLNHFDGLDLAFQLPRNKARKVHSSLGSVWKNFKKLFTGDFVVDEHAAEHKDQYTTFVQNLKNNLAREKLALSMTVLPNVNSTWYFDVPKLHNYFDFINLAAFDFVTPERNPEEADFSAPIYAPPIPEESNRLPYNNAEFQINYWLENQCPPHKLNLGLATYGRAWVMSVDSLLAGIPIVPHTLGAAPAGSDSKIAGLLSWPEICAFLPNDVNKLYRGAKAPLHKVVDIEQRYGNYAFRPADENGEHGMWVSYDGPDFAGVKTVYAKSKKLGGMAIFDLSYDDFTGLCTGQKFPILRSIKYYLD